MIDAWAPLLSSINNKMHRPVRAAVIGPCCCFIDISSETINSKWQGPVHDLLSKLENKEDWTLETTDEVYQRIENWALSLQNGEEVTRFAEHKEYFLTINVFLRLSKSLKFLHDVEAVDPRLLIDSIEFALQLIAQNQESALQRAANAYLGRFNVIYKSEILSRLFSRQKIQQVHAALDQTMSELRQMTDQG